MNSQWTDHVSGPHSWREAGVGRPVVFLHGLGGTRLAWGPQLRGLASDFRCVAWDMPGYGDAAALVPLTFEGVADRLISLFDLLEIDAADLVGLSFGGMHAIHAALRHPSRIRRMVLADTSPAFGIDGTGREEWQRARLEPLEQGATPGELGEVVIDSITVRRLNPQIRAELIAAFAAIDTAGFTEAVRCLPTNDVRARLGEIEIPSLVIVGELDRETPVSYSRAIVDGLPNAELRILDGTGHLSPSEDPDRFNDLVRTFLSA